MEKAPSEADDAAKARSARHRVNKKRLTIAGVLTGVVTVAAGVATVTGTIGGVVNWTTGTLVPAIAGTQTPGPTPTQLTTPSTTSDSTGWSEPLVGSRNPYLAVNAKMSPGNGCQGGRGWVFPRTAESLTPLTPARYKEIGMDAWAQENQGIPRTGNYIEVTLQELNNQTLIIHSIRAKVTKRSTVQSVTVLEAGACGGVPLSFFAVDLDKGDNPEAIPVQGETGSGIVPPTALPHKLDPGDQTLAWNVIVDTASCDCEFILQFDYTVAGQPYTYDVTLPGGEPWRVSSDTGASTASPDNNTGGWRTNSEYPPLPAPKSYGTVR